jgi:plastocyanin
MDRRHNDTEEALLIRIPLAAALAAGAALVATGSALAAPHATPTLNGTVGPGFTIVLKQNGKAVKTVKAGSYSFVIADKANTHNFVLEKKKGGSFEKELTDVPFTGKKTVKVKLTPGEWEFYCRPHESNMHGDFTVT